MVKKIVVSMVHACIDVLWVGLSWYGSCIVGLFIASRV